VKNWGLQIVLYLYFMQPLIVFLIFNTYETPHDCFKCFNRLGCFRYSSFQYTLEERNRNLEDRLGPGAVKIYQNLIIEAQKEVEIERLLLKSEERKTYVITAEG